MKIYIQKPWKKSDSPYYKSLKENPPADLEFFNISDKNLIQSKNSLKINNYIKQTIKKIIKKLYPSMANAHYTQNAEKYDLIFCAHCLSKNKHPWICNMEYVGQFWAAPIKYGVYASKKNIRKYIDSKYCKKIIAWTKWCAEDIIREFPEVKGKVEVVYPGISAQSKINRSKRKKTTLLFISRRFYFKGGLYAVEIMDRLTKKYKDVNAVVISDTPMEILEKYSNNKKINFMGMVPQKELFEKIYPNSDIFIYPSLTDTFGFGIIEAMSFGLPVISVDGQSRCELIKDGKTGLVTTTPFSGSIKNKWLENLEKITLRNLMVATEKLIKNKKLIKSMSNESIKLFESNGIFSIETRNKKLKKICKEAMTNQF